MFPYLQQPTIHESFSLMLMERIDNLEKENLALKQSIKDIKQNMDVYQKYNYFKFSKTFDMQYALCIEKKVKTYIDAIMSQRKIFNPVFMIWNYTVIDIFDMIQESQQSIIENRYNINITAYLVTENPVSLEEMIKYTNMPCIKINPLIGGLYELKTIIMEMVGYQILLPYLNENDRVEIWTRGGTFENDINPLMNEEPFTSSINYKKSEMLQQEYFQMIHNENWNELLNIFHRF